MPYNIQTPLSKRPRTRQRIKNPSRLVNVWDKFLALITLLHVLLCFLLYIWPPNPWVRALWDKDLPPVWLPQIPSCNSSRSSSTVSGCMHSRYGLEKESLYNFWSSDSQNRGAFLRTLSTLDLLSGKTSSLRNSTIESIQLGLTLVWWIWSPSAPTLIGLHKSSIRITWGELCVEEVANVVRE